MNPDDVIRMAREVFDIESDSRGRETFIGDSYSMERFAALVAAAEREACAKNVGEFAQKWWSTHCATNKHMETTRKAHDDFCALQAAIRARRGEK